MVAVRWSGNTNLAHPQRSAENSDGLTWAEPGQSPVAHLARPSRFADRAPVRLEAHEPQGVDCRVRVARSPVGERRADLGVGLRIVDETVKLGARSLLAGLGVQATGIGMLDVYERNFEVREVVDEHLAHVREEAEGPDLVLIDGLAGASARADDH